MKPIPITNMRVSEDYWGSAPCKQDYKDAKKLLRDFGISNPKIPECKTIGELQVYTKTAIDMQLA